MGYRKIPNLVGDSHPILQFRECFAMEKIEGTSTHIRFHREASVCHDAPWSYGVFSGGITHSDFLAMLLTKWKLGEVVARLAEQTLGRDVQEVIIYGEGYGGKCQKMGKTYGPTNFVAFEVQRGGYWLDVDRAREFVTGLGLPFVHYVKGPTTIEWLTQQRDKPSEQSRTNGIWDGNPETGKDFPSEGIVLRPPIELVEQSGGGPLRAKFRRPGFRETLHDRTKEPTDAEAMANAEKVAEEYCVAQRLEHVLSSMIAAGAGAEGPDGARGLTVKDTGLVIRAFIEDVAVESARDDGVVWTSEMGKAVGRKAKELFHARLRNFPSSNPVDGR